MAAHRHHGVVPICRSLLVAPSAVRSAMSRPACTRPVTDETVKPKLLAVFEANYRVYGRRKMKSALRREHDINLDKGTLTFTSGHDAGSPSNGRNGNRELGRRRPRHGAVQHHRCRQSAKSGPRRAAPFATRAALAMAPDQAPIRISPLPSRGPEGSNMCPLPASRKTTSSPEWPWNGAGTFATTAVFEP